MVYVRPSELPPEETNPDPLEADNELVRYSEPPGPLLPVTFVRGSNETSAAGGSENVGLAQLSPSPVREILEAGEPFSMVGGEDDPPEGFGSVMSERAFDRSEFLRQQQSDVLRGVNGPERGLTDVHRSENAVTGGVNGLEDVRDGVLKGPDNDRGGSVNGALAPPLMVAEPIREGRAFVVQDVPRGPIRGSLMQPRRLQRLFSGVALESGLASAPARGDDDMLTSHSPPGVGYGMAAPRAEGERGNALSPETGGVFGLTGGARRSAGFANETGEQLADGRKGESNGEFPAQRAPERVFHQTVASPPIAEHYVAAAYLSSRDAAQVGAGTGGSGSGTTGATGTPLKRKTAAEEARRQRARVEFETSLETLRVYAELTERDAVERAAEGLEVLEILRGRNKGLRLAAQGGLEAGLDRGFSGSATETRAGEAEAGGTLEGGMEGVTGEVMEAGGDEGLGGLAANQAGVSEGRRTVLSPEQRFAAAVADLQEVVQADGPHLDLDLDTLMGAPELAVNVETHAEMGLQEREEATFGLVEEVAGLSPAGGDARTQFEELARKTLEALGASPSSCANDASNAEARWGSPPLRAR